MSDALMNWIKQRFTRPEASDQRAAVQELEQVYGIQLVEHEGSARPWRTNELNLILDTIRLLGPTFYTPFLRHTLHLWIDRSPGGGSFGNGLLRIGDPGRDLSILYRIFLHEGTHASNEYQGWPYETKYCMKPGLDWQKVGGQWRHPRQQGVPPQPGEWETLPVDSRDVSTAPGEDLAEMVRYYVHSVRNERQWLWPLDLAKPPLYLWDTSPTRFVFVRDYFLALPRGHPWYKRLPAEVETRAQANLRD